MSQLGVRGSRPGLELRHRLAMAEKDLGNKVDSDDEDDLSQDVSSAFENVLRENISCATDSSFISCG